LGLSIFFAISGFLIARSWNADPAPLLFAGQARTALASSTGAGRPAHGPGRRARCELPVAFELPGQDRRLPLHRREQFLDTVNGRLPGVFVHNVYPAAVNGSLWTLPVETIAYAGIAVLGVLGALGERVMLAVLTFAVLLVLSTPLVGVGSIAVSGPIGGSLSLVLYLGAVQPLSSE
jgi:hypothetical protein